MPRGARKCAVARGAIMAITGDRYVGEFEGHTIELVRNNWVHVLTLLIDGAEVARASCHVPRRITLSGTLNHGGRGHDVVAKSVPRYFFWATDTVEVDGNELPLTKTK
jgi:hypothetical protein